VFSLPQGEETLLRQEFGHDSRGVVGSPNRVAREWLRCQTAGRGATDDVGARVGPKEPGGDEWEADACGTVSRRWLSDTQGSTRIEMPCALKYADDSGLKAFAVISDASNVSPAMSSSVTSARNGQSMVGGHCHMVHGNTGDHERPGPSRLEGTAHADARPTSPHACGHVSAQDLVETEVHIRILSVSRADALRHKRAPSG